MFSMIATVTRKNRIAIPAELVEKEGLKPGTRLEWRSTDRPRVLEVFIVPDVSSIASTLRGQGNRSRRIAGSPVVRLVQQREDDEETEDHP